MKLRWPTRVETVHGALLLFAAALLGKSAQVQLIQRERWARTAARQHFTERDVPAARGDIRDATGAVLAQSREMVRLDVAPREVRDREKLRRALVRAGVAPAVAQRAVDTRRAWVTIPGRFMATDVAGLVAMRGVHPRTIIERVYATSEGTGRILGRVGEDGLPLFGLELALDSVLRGTAGRAQALRDARGRALESPNAAATAAQPGQTVVLTLNHELQEIAERALENASAEMGASGGDIVVLDPHSGEVRAMASRRSDPRSTAATALTEPFEPGSTLKPFVAAALLDRKRVAPRDSVDTYGGQLTLHGRTITDVHKAGRLDLFDVIRWSSNVGIVKFAERLSPREQFEAMRDFGFGTATGVPYPSEASGRLREPARWSKQSPASLAMGYEMAVTPLQLAAAYATFANGGELLEPALVKEIRAPDGTVRYRHVRRVVRRPISREVAERVREMLVAVVEQGTALQADLSTFFVAGKTGTARVAVGGRYVPRSYTATFVGLFPAESPQYVILVKIDNPQGAYYGGTTAAPVTKAVLQAALAARDAALDRGKLAAMPRRVRRDTSAGRRMLVVATPAAESLPIAPRATDASADPPAHGSIPYVATLPLRPAPRPAAEPLRPVPDVRGMTMRAAVHALHRAGLRVVLAAGPGPATIPEAGTLVAARTTVRLHPP